MGLITNLVKMNEDKKTTDKTNQVTAYKALLTDQNATDEARQWAINNIVTLAGGGKGDKAQQSPLHAILSHLVGGLKSLNPSPAAPKSVGERPQKLEYSPEEMQQRQLKLQKTQDQADRGKEQAQADFKLVQEAKQVQFRKNTLDGLIAAYKKAGKPDWEAQRDAEIDLGLKPTGTGTEPPKPATPVKKPNTPFEERALASYAKKLGKDIDDLNFDEIETFNKQFHKDERKPVSINVNGGATKDDIKSIAGAIANGDQPPTLTGLYRNGAAVRAELERQGFNLTQATIDWKAMEKYVSVQNGDRQQRLRQATEFASESLDVINELSSKLSKVVPRSKFPLFNRAALTAAKSGSLGQEAEDAAVQLESQIVDLQSELATVYKGGNSPTDVGIDQALRLLRSDWNEKTLKGAVDLARRNLRIRLASLKNIGVSGMSQNSVYRGDVGGSNGSVDSTGGGSNKPLIAPSKPGARLSTLDAKKYIDAAGGDKNKAREAAKKDGWSF